MPVSLAPVAWGIVAGSGREGVGQLEQAHARGALGQVVAQVMQQAGGQHGAQGILFGGERVHDGDAAFGGQAQQVQILWPTKL